ncbi:hypothetical protein RRG08_011709 [Elysia crispata]|uniref:Uncharacterized protein n=1 Tax=Elysia crispata TaxID=231223 RepID=A0AAE1AY94_9GAST|nr:hypothetical protein RRG08_011709 [Elysia crispata]
MVFGGSILPQTGPYVLPRVPGCLYCHQRDSVPALLFILSPSSSPFPRPVFDDPFTFKRCVSFPMSPSTTLREFPYPLVKDRRFPTVCPTLIPPPSNMTVDIFDSES